MERGAEDEASEFFNIWVRLAESEIYNVLRASWMIRRGTAIVQAAVSDPAPSSVQVINVGLIGDEVTTEHLALLAAVPAGGPAPTPPTGEIIRHLEPLGPEQLAPFEGHHDRRYANGYGLYDEPQGFAVEGHSIRLVRWPGRPVWLSFSYYSRGKRLLDGPDTNETLYHLPGAYFYGCQRHAAIMYGDRELEERATRAFLAEIERANSEAYGAQGTGITARRGGR